MGAPPATRHTIDIVQSREIIRPQVRPADGNKYHVNFHIQADRLSNFTWFRMEYLCEVPKYARFVHRLVRWIDGGGNVS